MKRSSGSGLPRMIDPVQSAVVEPGEMRASASLMMSFVLVVTVNVTVSFMGILL
jgi:hypothetical protein